MVFILSQILFLFQELNRNKLLELILYLQLCGHKSSSITEMCDIFFSVNCFCTFDFDKVGLLWMLTFLRLFLRPLLLIASTIKEKHAGSAIQSVVLTPNRALPQLWNPRYLISYLRSFPKSIPEEQWMQQ